MRFAQIMHDIITNANLCMLLTAKDVGNDANVIWTVTNNEQLMNIGDIEFVSYQIKVKCKDTRWK